MRLFKTGEKRGKGRIKKLIALIVAGTMLAGSVSYAAGTKGLSIYLDIMNTKALVKDGYTNQSGFCTDNDGNIYLARIRNSDKNVRLFKNSEGDNQEWQMSRLNGWAKNSSQRFNIGHANDMTYCNRDDKIYVCTKGGNNDTELVIGAINKYGKCCTDNNLYYLGELESTLIDSKGKKIKDFCCSPSGIAYDEINEVFYLTQKLNNKLVVSVFGLQNGNPDQRNDKKSVVLELQNTEKYVPQGITCRGEYLFVSLWEANGIVEGKNYSGNNKSIVVPYKIDVDENEIYTFKEDDKNILKLNQGSTGSKFEIEGISFVGGDLLMAFNADEGKGDAIYSYRNEYYTSINLYHNKMIEYKKYLKSIGK